MFTLLRDALTISQPPKILLSIRGLHFARHFPRVTPRRYAADKLPLPGLFDATLPQSSAAADVHE